MRLACVANFEFSAYSTSLNFENSVNSRVNVFFHYEAVIWTGL